MKISPDKIILVTVRTLVILLAAMLLLMPLLSTTQSSQPQKALVRFQGEYRIGDGPWQTVQEGKRISALSGPVTLRGEFCIASPDGKIQDALPDGMFVMLWINHLAVEIYQNGEMVMAGDSERPALGSIGCGSYQLVMRSEHLQGDITMVLTNPHSFGNGFAINEMLESLDFKTSDIFVETSWNSLNILGLVAMVLGVAASGAALAATVSGGKNRNILWAFSGCILLMAVYHFSLADRESAFSLLQMNTTLKVVSMMLYVSLLEHIVLQAPGRRSKALRMAGLLITAASMLAALTGQKLYDLLLPWAAAQSLLVLVGVGVSLRSTQGMATLPKWMMRYACLLLLCMPIDLLGNLMLWWAGTPVCVWGFWIALLLVVVLLLATFPGVYRDARRTREMEEQLQEQRVRIMLSQIQPHFLYNALTVTMSLCDTDPKLAKRAIGDFAKYLRGNLESLTNKHPVSFQDELRHVEVYARLEKLRFEERLSVVYDVEEEDFRIPALTVQPLVENAIKHGLNPKPQGGTVTIRSWQEAKCYMVQVSDDGVGFDPEEVGELPGSHVGIENVRDRLKSLSNATLTLESTPGQGTVATISIPKGGKQ